MLHPLHLSSDAPAWVLAAAWPVLMVHITGGIVAILAGAVALAARKGERLHRAAGKVFFVAMLAMAGMGGLIAAAEPNRPTAVGAVFVIYLTATAWATARRPDGPVGRLAPLALALVVAIIAADLMLIAIGLNNPNGLIDRLPWQPALVMAVVASIAALSDLRVIRRGISGAPRIARHLWRMCTALFIASGSFFLGQQKVMPQAIHGSPLLIVLAVAPLVLMVFWLIRIRIGDRFRSTPPGIQPARP